MAEGVSIVIPAYNEETGLGPAVDEIGEVMRAASLEHEIIVVDDGSTDGTAEVAARRGENVRLIKNKRNVGYGASLKRGIQAARFPVVVITDADGTYPSEHIPGLVEKLTPDTSMVVGWRKGFSARIPLVRRPAKWVMRKFAESMAAHPIPDLNSGLRVLRKEDVLRYARVLPEGFSFTATITLLILSSGGTIVYEPIGYNHRVGKSKFHPVRDVIGMVGLIIRSILLFYPLRFFVPVALGCFTVGGAILIAALLGVFERIPDATIVIFVMTGLQFLCMGFLADLINRRSQL